MFMKKQAVQSVSMLKALGEWRATCLDSLRLWTNAVTVQHKQHQNEISDQRG